MATQYRAAIIGCGRPHGKEGATGSGIAHHHARGYENCPGVQIVALADIKKRHAQVFAKEHSLDVEIYTDYNEMLREEDPDIVSVCLWPELHAPVTIDCAEAGVRAVHCEKPMAPTWGEAVQMAEACERAGTQLTFNHQRRFLPAFRTAKQLANDGTIGDLIRIEGSCSNMIDWGTHWIDMMFMFNNNRSAKWVMGQIDAREVKEIFGLKVEWQAICQFMFENGVRALLFTGADSDIGCQLRLQGMKGVAELRAGKKPLWLRKDGSGKWTTPKIAGGLHGGDAFAAAIKDAVACLSTGEEPELSAKKALRATEVIFALYESSRSRCRIDLPLETQDSAFLTMLDEREIAPKKAT